MSFYVSKRVVSRYVQALASTKLPPLLDAAKEAAGREDWRASFDAYDKFLKVLGIFGTASSDSLRFTNEWANNLTHTQLDEYRNWLKEITGIRERLRRAAFPQSGEMPQPGDVEWDIGSLKYGFLEWLEPLFRDDDDAFTHGAFKVILADDARDGLEEALKTLDAAVAKIKTKFAKVLYGKVFVTRGLKGGTFQTAPNRAGSYVAASDSINLSLYALPTRDSIMTLIHEFGHRYHTRFLSGELRDKFIQLSTEGDYEVLYFRLSEREKLVDEYIRLLQMHRIGEFPTKILSDRAELFFHNYPRDEWKAKVVPLVRKYRDDADDTVEEKLREALGMYWLGGNVRVETNKEKRHPLSASPYGSTNWEENFAECFLHYCIGRELPEPLQRFMESL